MKSISQKLFLAHIIIALGAVATWRGIELVQADPYGAGSSYIKGIVPGFLVLLGLIAALQLFLHKTVTLPVRALVKAVRARVRSADATPLPIFGDDEIAALARSFNALQRRIDQQMEDLRQFAANVCHEIKTPLASIVTHAELIAANERIADSAASTCATDDHHALKIIQQEAMRMAKLADDMLTSVRVERMPLRRAPTDMIELAKNAAHAVGVLPRVKLTGDVGMQLEVDKEDFRRVFINLLENSRDFAPENSLIEIKFSTTKKEATIALFNLSEWIAVEVKPRIFERFFSKGISSAGQERGRSARSGLGLAICRDIVQIHGGTVEVENIASGGVAFVIRLPLE